MLLVHLLLGCFNLRRQRLLDTLLHGFGDGGLHLRQRRRHALRVHTGLRLQSRDGLVRRLHLGCLVLALAEFLLGQPLATGFLGC